MRAVNPFPGMNPYLKLQVLIDQTYRLGRYDDINYNIDPTPPLGAEDAAWAAELLKAKGLR